MSRFIGFNNASVPTTVIRGVKPTLPTRSRLERRKETSPAVRDTWGGVLLTIRTLLCSRATLGRLQRPGPVGELAHGGPDTLLNPIKVSPEGTGPPASVSHHQASPSGSRNLVGSDKNSRQQNITTTLQPVADRRGEWLPGQRRLTADRKQEASC